MCGKHDDPSMIDMPREVTAEEEYAMKFYAEHEHAVWMRENDPNTWAWLLPRDVRLEKFSEAVRGANEMRRNAYKRSQPFVCSHGWVGYHCAEVYAISTPCPCGYRGLHNPKTCIFNPANKR